MTRSSRNLVVYAALAGNLLVAVTKFVASAITGSAGMFSEAVHSVVDTGNEALLLYGIHRAARPASPRFPFGQARELYFWSFVVAILIFGVGAGLAFYEGAASLAEPRQLEDPLVSYVVLGLAACFEAASWTIAYREFRRSHAGRGFWRAIERSKDPRLFLVLLEDSAALVGLAIAFAGVLADDLTGDPRADAIASLAIGAVLAGVAAVLARECKGLLVGESADPEIVAGVRRIAAADPRIVRVNDALTMQLGPEDILLNLSVDFVDDATAGEVEACIGAMDRRIRAEHGTIRHIFIEAESVGRVGASSSDQLGR